MHKYNVFNSQIILDSSNESFVILASYSIADPETEENSRNLSLSRATILPGVSERGVSSDKSTRRFRYASSRTCVRGKIRRCRNSREGKGTSGRRAWSWSGSRTDDTPRSPPRIVYRRNNIVSSIIDRIKTGKILSEATTKQRIPKKFSLPINFPFFNLNLF